MVLGRDIFSKIHATTSIKSIRTADKSIRVVIGEQRPGLATVVKINLPGEEIVQSNPLATVTTNFVVLRDPEAQSHMIIALSGISGIKKIETSHPGLLVISLALFLTAAAAFCSKDGHGAHIPIAAIGVAFVIAYLISRRAAVGLIAGSTVIETEMGGLTEAAAVIKAVQAARKNMREKRDDAKLAWNFEPPRT